MNVSDNRDRVGAQFIAPSAKTPLTGPEAALCALSFFRHRHDTRARFKNARRKHNQARQVSVNREYIQAARQFAREARAAGFHGSFAEASTALAKERR